MKVKNVTIYEYITGQDNGECDAFLDVINPKNELCGNDCNFNRLTFDEVEVIKSILRNPNLKDMKDIFMMLYNVRGSFKQSAENEFYEESIYKFFAARKYLINFINEISEKERKHLSTEACEKWEMVNGGKRLAPVSHLLTKIRLAKEFSTTPREIGNMKYSEIFSILVAENRYNSVMKDYNQIK